MVVGSTEDRDKNGRPPRDSGDQRDEIPHHQAKIRRYLGGQVVGLRYQVTSSDFATRSTAQQSLAMLQPQPQISGKVGVVVALQSHDVRTPFKTACFYHAIL